MDEPLSRAIIDLLLDSPFFGHVAGGMGRLIDPAWQWPVSLTVRGDQYFLVVSPSRFAALSRARRVVALEHELLHAVLDHPLRAQDHLQQQMALFGVACDLVVNQYLRAGPPLPRAHTVGSWRPEPLPPGLSAGDYFALLKRDSAGVAACEGGASQHPWLASPSSLQLARAQLEPVVLSAARRVGQEGCGKLPGEVAVWIQSLVDEAEGRIDWRRALRLFAAGSRRNRIRSTLRRPSRRYHEFPGIRVARGQRLAVCVDTSGSISDETLAMFFAEIHGIWQTRAEVMVFEVDAALQRTWRYTGRLLQAVSGRGGTDFNPGLRAVREAVPRFDACVYLTDGEAPAPEISPGVPLLWVVTPKGRSGDHLRFGRVIQITEL